MKKSKLFVLFIFTVVVASIFVIKNINTSELDENELVQTVMNSNFMISSTIEAISESGNVSLDQNETRNTLKNTAYYLYEPYEMKKSIPDFEITISDRLFLRFYDEGNKKVVLVNDKEAGDFKSYAISKRDWIKIKNSLKLK